MFSDQSVSIATLGVSDSFENDSGVDGKQDLFVCSLLLEGRSVGSRRIKVG